MARGDGYFAGEGKGHSQGSEEDDYGYGKVGTSTYGYGKSYGKGGTSTYGDGKGGTSTDDYGYGKGGKGGTSPKGKSCPTSTYGHGKGYGKGGTSTYGYRKGGTSTKECVRMAHNAGYLGGTGKGHIAGSEEDGYGKGGTKL